MVNLKNCRGFVAICICITAIFAMSITGQNESAANSKIARAKTFKVVSFMLIEGQIIRGRVIDEDRNFITIEYPNQSKLDLMTVSRDNIMPNSLTQQSVSEFEYWNQLSDYFAARTWDFKDDPDDFMQAIRCLENAKQITVDLRGQDHPQTLELQASIDKLTSQRDQWVEKAKIRAEQITLETQVALDETLKNLSGITAANSEQIARIQRTLELLGQTDAKLEDLKTQFQKDSDAVSANIKAMSKDIELNTIRVDQLWRRYDQPYYYDRGQRGTIERQN